MTDTGSDAWSGAAPWAAGTGVPRRRSNAMDQGIHEEFDMSQQDPQNPANAKPTKPLGTDSGPTGGKPPKSQAMGGSEPGEEEEEEE